MGATLRGSTGELKILIDTLQPEIQASTPESSADSTSCISRAQTITNCVCEYITFGELDTAK